MTITQRRRRPLRDQTLSREEDGMRDIMTWRTRGLHDAVTHLAGQLRATFVSATGPLVEAVTGTSALRQMGETPTSSPLQP